MMSSGAGSIKPVRRLAQCRARAIDATLCQYIGEVALAAFSTGGGEREVDSASGAAKKAAWPRSACRTGVATHIGSLQTERHEALLAPGIHDQQQQRRPAILPELLDLLHHVAAVDVAGLLAVAEVLLRCRDRRSNACQQEATSPPAPCSTPLDCISRDVSVLRIRRGGCFLVPLTRLRVVLRNTSPFL
jgi:hypothetical protein